MSKIIRIIENKVNSLPEGFMVSKTKYGEKKAIKKKKLLYSGIVWTKEQEDRFNRFWIENYGKKINPAWHKLYQSANGVFDEKYFPEYFYTTRLEPALNPLAYCKVLSDKNLLPYIFGGNDSGVYIPKVYLSCVNGRYKTIDNKLLSRTQAEQYMCNIGQCVFKPSVDTGSGSGVFIADIDGDIDKNSNKTISEIMDSLGKNFLVQETVHNNSRISKVCPKSLNTFRIITYYVDDDIHYAPLVMRMGSGSNLVDNIHAGGLCIGVNVDGTLKTKAYQLGYGDNNLTFTTHPYSHVEFENYYIGDIDKAVNAAIELHKRIPQLGIVSWDFTINDKEQAVLIEANCRDQSIWFPQVVNECSFFRENTAYFSKMLRDKLS